jgi:predicted Zn-dependent peptidase
VRSLREEKGWVRSVQAYFMPQKHPGLFVIAAQSEEEFLDAVEAEIRTAVARLGDEPVSAQELARAVRMLRNDFVFNTEAPSQLAGLYGYYSTLADLETALRYPQLLRQLGVEDLRRAAHAYLDAARAVVLRLLPAEEVA